MQPGLTGTVGERLHEAVVAVATAIEHDALDAGALRALGEQRPRAAGLLHPAELLQVLLGPVDGGQGEPGHVVDELRLHALVRAEHGQPRPLGGAAHLGAHATAAAQPLRIAGLDAHARLPTFRATYSSA